MIYTVTCNPSIDYIIQTPSVQLGEVNRSTYDKKLPGGKGINVSRILNELSVTNTALGFVGNITGQMFTSLIKNIHLKTDFTTITDDNRINVKVKSDTEETEINGTGPTISSDEKDNLLDKLSNLTSNDAVIVSGSLAKNLEQSFYEEIAQTAYNHEAEFVVDTTGQALLDTLKYHPVLVKPNNHELADLFNVEINSSTDIIKYAKKLIDLGAKNVLVSMAGDGSILVTPDHIYQNTPPKGTVVNSVGAGDSMIGGFVGTYIKNHDLKESLKVGAACGSATAFSEDIATKDKIDEIYQQIEIKEITEE